MMELFFNHWYEIVPPSETLAITENDAACPTVRFIEKGWAEIDGATALIFVVTDASELSIESSKLIPSPTAMTATL